MNALLSMQCPEILFQYNCINHVINYILNLMVGLKVRDLKVGGVE